MPLITGNTYPHRFGLRALGGQWNASLNGWDVPEAMADEARALLTTRPSRGGTRSANRGAARQGSTYTRFSTGAEVFTNRNGRCEDAPCCGCCS